MPYFKHKNADLYYEDHGQGNALLFLHGASLDMRQWNREVRHFSKSCRVITLDARGHGRSTLPPGEVMPDIFWQDAYALLRHLNIKSAAVCGLSMGGHTALQLAAHAPEIISALILIGTPCTNKFNLYERVCVPINLFSLRLMPMSWLAWCLGTFLGNTKETRTYIKNTVRSMDHGNFNRTWKAVTGMESRPLLSRVKCPTLILIGDRDSLTGRQQDFIHRSIPGSRLTTIENAHHGTNLDNPEQVEKEISRFLKECSHTAAP